VVTASGPGWAVDLSAHRAIYDMSLQEASQAGDIADMEGEMYLEWGDVCEGWTVTQRVRMRSILRDGPEIENRFNFSSWESRDGQEFRFAMRNLSMGQVADEVSGRAYLEGPDAGGKVEFSEPESEIMGLPPGTMFPSSHLVALVEHAMAGKKHFQRTVFSGSGVDSLNPVSAFIGNPIAAGARPLEDRGEPTEAIRKLSERRSWPVGLAYYPMTGAAEEPEFEVSYRLFDNGIAADLTLNYGDFVLSAVLEEIELLPKPDC